MNPEQKRVNETSSFLQSDPTRGNAESSKAEQAASLEQELPQELNKGFLSMGRMMRGLMYIGGAYILYRMGRRVLRRGNEVKDKD